MCVHVCYVHVKLDSIFNSQKQIGIFKLKIESNLYFREINNKNSQCT